MSDDDNFLSRWSRRKEAVKAGRAVDAEADQPQPVIPVATGIQPEAEAHAELPPIESLTPDSDFTAFMKPDVDSAMRREALKVLVRDPRFNVMDGLDVYIDDYSKPDPLPPEWLGQLNMTKRLGIFVEEDEKLASEAAGALQESVPDEPREGDRERLPAGTAEDNATTKRVTESGTGGGKLPSNEA